MKSPCLDYKGSGLPCRYAHLDKNNVTCLNCEDRLKRVDSIGKCPGSSMALEVSKNGEGRDLESEAHGNTGTSSGRKEEKMKKCTSSKCPHNGIPQSMDEFDNSKKTKDGKASYCKTCRRRMQSEYRDRKIAKKKAGPAVVGDKDNKKPDRLRPMVESTATEALAGGPKGEAETESATDIGGYKIVITIDFSDTLTSLVKWLNGQMVKGF